MWTGTIFKITRNVISKSVSQEKWMKGCDIIKSLSYLLSDHPFGRPILSRENLERQSGFLNHLTMTFDEMSPFLKGFYLTLNSWRPKRDKDDWRMSDKTWMQCLVAQFDNVSISEIEFENEVKFQADIGCPESVNWSRSDVHLRFRFHISSRCVELGRQWGIVKLERVYEHCGIA